MKKTILSILMLFMVTSLFAGESDNQKEIEKLKAEISLLSRQLQSMTNQLEKLEKDVKEAPSSQQKSVYQKNAEEYKEFLRGKMAEWKGKLAGLQHSRTICYLVGSWIS